MKELKKPPFNLGLQSYSLRKFDLDQVLQKAGELGIRNLEFFPAHLPMELSDQQVDQMKQKFTQAGIKLPAYGVISFGTDEGKNRAAFEFARKFRIPALTADPAPESFVGLDALVDEFNVKVAIHNHGPGSRYATVDDVLSAVKDHDPRIGACVDTGHFLRSKEDPVNAIERLGKRVHVVHLKDIRSYEDHTNVVNGRGLLDLSATVAALRTIDFKGAVIIEYEAEPEHPEPAIADCVAEVMKAVQGS